MPLDLLQDLNPEQRLAVEAPEGPALVLAGPGSGKTRVLTHRAAYLVDVQAVPPWQIMAVTFTNKAAREMASRLRDLIGPEWAKDVAVGTFHSVCARLLRAQAARGSLGFGANFVIYDVADQLRVVKRALEDLNLDPEQHKPRSVHGLISKAKNELMGPESFVATTYPEEIAGRVYGRYQHLLRKANAMDFDDLLLEFAWLLERDIDVRSYYQARYRHVLVDEFQDTNSAQYAIAKHLAAADNLRAARNLFAVGDEDQSIYSWRGADFRNVRRFRRDFPDALVVLLERNYRSTQNILDAARGVIDRNTERTEKKLWTDVGSGPKVTLFEAYNESEEAAYVVRRIQDLEATGERLGEIAVTYRTNAQSRAVEEVLVRNRIPYALIGGARFYERREVKDVLAYLRLVHNPADDVSFERIVNVPPRKIGASAQGMVRSWADAAGVTLAEALHALAGEDEPPDGATPVSTRARNALAEFDELLETLLKAREEYTVPDLVAFVLAKSGYAHWLRDGSEEGEERWENVREFRGVAEDFAAYEPREGLAAFLESVALVADVDSLDTSSDRVTLLTLHSAKGLEFSTVFITGVEEKVLPHSLSMDDPSAVEEERRLFYVGVTRARRRLYLLRTFRRSLYGASSGEVREPSRFLADIPESVLETAGAAVTGRAKPAAPDRTVWTTSRSRAAEADTSGETGFKAGDKVQHGTFGDGVVVSSRVTDGDEEVTVAFADIGVKKLLQSYARLEHR